MTTNLLRPSPRVIASTARATASELGRPLVVGTYRDLRRPRARRAPQSVPRTEFDPTLPASIANPYPDFARLREHPAVVNERLDVWMLGRYTAVIPRGGRVVLFYASANRDPLKFPHPNRFDIHRATAGHLAFGHGIHFCLGAHLARLEVVTAIDHLLDEAGGLELAGPVRWGTTPSLQGPVSVPVRARRVA